MLNIEENCKISNEGMNKNRTEYSNMTVYMRKINGNAISVKCDRQKAAIILEIVERKTSTPPGMMYFVNQGKVLNDKRTIEANNTEAGTTIEMPLRKMRGMEREELMATSETERRGSERMRWRSA